MTPLPDAPRSGVLIGPGEVYIAPHGAEDGWTHIGTTDGLSDFEFEPAAPAGFAWPPVLPEVTVTLDMSDFTEKLAGIRLAAFGSPFLKMAEGLSESVRHAADLRERPRWHFRNCRTCRPHAHPLPFPGGREYRRRQKARKKRGRR